MLAGSGAPNAGCLSCRAGRGVPPPCKGEPQLALRVHPSHQAAIFVAEEEPLVACLACGSYGSSKAYNLAERCEPDKAKVKYGRRRALRRLARGTHPGNGKDGIVVDPVSDAPGLLDVEQLGVSPPQPQRRMLRLGKETCRGCALRLLPAWAATIRTPELGRRLKQPECDGHPKGP